MSAWEIPRCMATFQSNIWGARLQSCQVTMVTTRYYNLEKIGFLPIFLFYLRDSTKHLVEPTVLACWYMCVPIQCSFDFSYFFPSLKTFAKLSSICQSYLQSNLTINLIPKIYSFLLRHKNVF